MRESNRYGQIIERIFLARYQEGTHEIIFEREDLVAVAEELQIKLPKNLGDVIYSFRYHLLADRLHAHMRILFILSREAPGRVARNCLQAVEVFSGEVG